MKPSLRRSLYSLIFILVMVPGLLVFMRNSGEVEFNYLLGSISLSLAGLMLLCFCAGVVAGLAALLPMLVRQRWRIARLVKQGRMAQTEIDNLRTLPLRDKS